MLVVIAIIGFFLLISIPAVANYLRGANVRTAADQLVKDLQSCRYIAVTTRQTRTLSLGSPVPATSYQYTDVRGNVQIVTLPGQGTVTIDSASNFPVTFNSLGGLQGSPATATVTGRITPTRSHIYTISVEITGKVTKAYNFNAP